MPFSNVIFKRETELYLKERQSWSQTARVL